MGRRDVSKLDKLVGKAKEHLEEGEQVETAINGKYETKIGGNDTVRSGILMATDRRLVFYAKKLAGYDLEVFPYENISSIEMGKNMSGHYVTFFASGNKVHLKWIDKKQDLSGFITAVKTRIAGGSAAAREEMPATPKSEDLASQIRKLAELRDEGILTEDEFQAKKTDLLES